MRNEKQDCFINLLILLFEEEINFIHLHLSFRFSFRTRVYDFPTMKFFSNQDTQ